MQQAISYCAVASKDTHTPGSYDMDRASHKGNRLIPQAAIFGYCGAE